MRVAVLAITRHGIVLGGRIVAALPDACLLAPELSLKTNFLLLFPLRSLR